jgi:hypothetical protein
LKTNRLTQSKLYRILRFRYWERWRRYKNWLQVFEESKLTGPEWRRQAWRQSAWYEPRTGRSVEYLEAYGHGQIRKP